MLRGPENRGTVGAELEMPKASRGEGNGEGLSYPVFVFVSVFGVDFNTLIRILINEYKLILSPIRREQILILINEVIVTSLFCC